MVLEPGQPWHAKRWIDIRHDLADASSLASPACHVEDAKPRNWLALHTAKLAAYELVAGADREYDRAALGSSRNAAVHAQPARREDLWQVLAAAEQVNVAVDWHRLVRVDLDRLDLNAAQLGPASKHQHVAPVAVSAKEIRVHPDEPKPRPAASS